MLDDEVDAEAFAPLAGQAVWADVTPLPLVCVCGSRLRARRAR
jgi:hypothetical protein